MRTTERYDELIAGRAEQVIAQGAFTNSKRPQSFVKGVYPTHLTKGLGCHVWDTKGNKYVDFICGLGTNLLGYAQDELTEAISKQAKLGASLSLGTEIEVQLAERLGNLFPYMEKFKFLKTGSEGCSAAVRMARAKTEREFIVSEGYHGWHDEFVSLTPPALGVPKGNKESIILLAIGEAMPWFLDPNFRPAAFIVEPIISDLSEKRINWLKNLRDLCSRYGSLLIFDETITALRVPGYSVANHTGIYPDLTVFGKALGNGMPISVVGGKKEIMDSDYFVSGTFFGETVSIASALKTVELLTTKYKIEYLWEKGKEFLKRFNAVWDQVQLEGYPTRSVLKGSAENKALFMQECARAGILVGPSFFFNFHHIELMEEVLSTFSDILTRIRLGEVKLLGEMPQTPFAQKVRENERNDNQ